MHCDPILSPETRKELLGLLGEQNGSLIGQIEQILGSARRREQGGPAVEFSAMKELSAYESALRSVLDSYNALSFKAHRTLAEMSGRQPGGLPALYGEAQTELRRIKASKQALVRDPQRGAPQGITRDQISGMLARIMDAAGQGGDEMALARLTDIVVPAAIGELRAEPERVPAAAATFGLAVIEPFDDYGAGKVIADPAEISYAEQEHPGKTVRITLK